jgi:hypothetical protein
MKAVAISRGSFFFSLLIATAVLSSCAEVQSHEPLQGLPTIAEYQIFNEDWNHDHWNAASDRFSNVLRQQYPLGSPEAGLVQALLQQGFKYPPPAKPGCVDPKKIMPLGVAYVPCPTYDPKYLLKYTWSPHELPVNMQLFCSQTVGVIWTATDGKLTSLKGFYGGECP